MMDAHFSIDQGAIQSALAQIESEDSQKLFADKPSFAALQVIGLLAREHGMNRLQHAHSTKAVSYG